MTDATITLTRLFDAPRALVFECWLKPEHLVHWYSAGDGWTTPYAESDWRTDRPRPMQILDQPEPIDRQLRRAIAKPPPSVPWLGGRRSFCWL